MALGPTRSTYRVTVRAHRVADRYDIPADEKTIGTDTPERARLTVLRGAHRDAGVPPWKPYVRESWPYTEAVRTVATTAEHMRERTKSSKPPARPD